MKFSIPTQKTQTKRSLDTAAGMCIIYLTADTLNLLTLKKKSASLSAGGWLAWHCVVEWISVWSMVVVYAK